MVGVEDADPPVLLVDLIQHSVDATTGGPDAGEFVVQLVTHTPRVAQEVALDELNNGGGNVLR